MTGTRCLKAMLACNGYKLKSDRVAHPQIFHVSLFTRVEFFFMISFQTKIFEKVNFDGIMKIMEIIHFYWYSV